MKNFLKFAFFALVLLLVSSCNFTITDPRSPAEATATNEVRMTATADANLVPTVTAEASTPEPPLPTFEPQVVPEDCVVKGNVSSSGEKIYHVKGQSNYVRVIIDPDHGERCFATEEDAVAAGWRKSQR